MNDDFLIDISNDIFKRVDSTHPIDWRLNDAESPTKLALISKEKPSDFTETNGIHISVISQTNGLFAVVFVLKDSLCAEIFKAFCNDVIESSRSIDPEDAVNFAFERYVMWMYLFKPRSSNRFSEKEIRGLLGELYVMREGFIPKFGPSSALKSWMFHLGGKQDFIEHDQWYEVKTLLEGNDTIHISSLEQLARNDKGELIIIRLRKTSPESKESMTLISLYSDIMGLLPSFDLKKRFSQIMLDSGFIVGDDYYNDFRFEVVNIRGYDVREGFPKLTPGNIPYPGIVKADYEISIDSIKQFEVKSWI